MPVSFYIYWLTAALTVFIHDVLDLGNGVFIVSAILFALGIRSLWRATYEDDES